ncbi:hypothetical protein LDENG_00297260 [Lucifuga dentata]|nr:hypothetical protein LDENG_00297260 [Lucifuga dentata]
MHPKTRVLTFPHHWSDQAQRTRKSRMSTSRSIRPKQDKTRIHQNQDPSGLKIKFGHQIKIKCLR